MFCLAIGHELAQNGVCLFLKKRHSFQFYQSSTPQGSGKFLRMIQEVSILHPEDPHDPVVQVAQIVDVTEAEGPGKRFALWFQGCPLRCPGCCNPQMLPFKGGQSTFLSQIVERIRIAQARQGIEGIALLGGEPTAHAPVAALIAKEARSLGLSVMVYSGFTLNELQVQTQSNPDLKDLLDLVDVLVDGPYHRDQPETHRRWIGSTNQQVHLLTDRYSPNDPRWTQPNTIEVRLREGQLSINGFPAPQAARIWKRIP